MTKQEAEELIEQRGFMVMSESVSNDVTECLRCADKNYSHVSLTVWLESERFEFNALVMPGALTLSTGKLSPFSDEERFNKFFNYIKNAYNKL